MKLQKFSISDILNRDSQKKRNEKNWKTILTNKKESELLSSQTPPMTTEVDKRMKFYENSKVVEPLRRSQEPITFKRSKDPIGQILDNLCRTSVDKMSNVPSAFSSILTSPFTNQLSSLSFLAHYDKRNIQTSPSVFGSPYAAPLLDFTSTQVKRQTSTDDLQYLHAQQKFEQQLHFHRLAMNAGAYSITQPVVQRWQQGHFQRTYDHQTKFMAIENCNSEMCSNRYSVHSNMFHTQHSQFLMAYFQPSEEESLTVKQSRIPQPSRYQCETCHKSYSTFGGLCKHKQLHCVSHIKREFKCQCCEKSYGSLGALKMHIRTHTLPCKCKLCGKAFSRPWLLQGHLRTHNGEKPFKCAHCGRAFADRSNLRAHLQTHSDVKKYGCKNCSKTFSRMSLLLKHEEGSCLGLRR